MFKKRWVEVDLRETLYANVTNKNNKIITNKKNNLMEACMANNFFVSWRLDEQIQLLILSKSNMKAIAIAIE